MKRNMYFDYSHNNKEVFVFDIEFVDSVLVLSGFALEDDLLRLDFKCFQLFDFLL